MRPPFSLTSGILKWSSEISRIYGQVESRDRTVPRPELRRKSRIKSIQGSLAIEGNTLSLEQVTTVLEGKRIIGPQRDVLEATNAWRAYEEMERYDIHSPKSFLKAHRLMMNGLIASPGEWRRGNVGIQKGKSVAHLAPPPGMVPGLMKELFR
jgi:Fic family protein